MLVATDAKQMEGILNMGGGGVKSMTICALAFIHPGMVTESALGTPRMMSLVIKGDRAELPLTWEKHIFRPFISKNLSTHDNQNNRQSNKNDSFHTNPVKNIKNAKNYTDSAV